MLKPKVAVVLGSESDLPVIQDMLQTLKDFEVQHEVTVTSAHRSPERTYRYAATLEERGVQVIIACAGAAAHLAGVLAAHTILPVIGVPVDSSPLQGLDALLSTSMMPAGVPSRPWGSAKPAPPTPPSWPFRSWPEATPTLAQKLKDYKKQLAERVEERDRELKKKRES